MTTPGFRPVYIPALDEPGIHPPKQIGHPDRQEGGSDFANRKKAPWSNQEIAEITKLWNQGYSTVTISKMFPARIRTALDIQKKLHELRQEGMKLRVPRKGGKRVRVKAYQRLKAMRENLIEAAE